MIIESKNKLGFILVSQFLAFSLSASDSPVLYKAYADSPSSFIIAKLGDTISGILFALNLKPIYGKRGLLKETLQLNPQVKNRLDYKIFPGERIKIPLVVEEKNNSFLLNSNETKALSEGSPASVYPAPDMRVPIDDFKQGFSWKIAPSLSWKALTSKDENIFRQSNIQVLSQTNYAAAITYEMHFEENLDFYSRVFLESVSFQSDNSISLVRNNFLSTSFAFGGFFEKKYGLELGMDNQFFLTSSASKSIEIKKVTLPKVNFGYSKVLYQNRQSLVRAIFSGRAFLPRSSSELQTKLGFGAGAEFQFKLLNQSFGICYDYNVLKSQSNTTNSQNISWKYLWETQ